MYLQAEHWANLLSQRSTELTDRLVLHSSGVVQVLSKMESKEFIHTYIRSHEPGSDGTTQQQHTMLFELPRFNLGFGLRGRQLHSLDYSGFSVHPCQQLVVQGEGRGCIYTMPDFHRYLVLQQGAGSGKQQVLVPVGEVQRGPASVSVMVDGSSGAQLKVGAVFHDSLIVVNGYPLVVQHGVSNS
jgi:hypothetical protein